MCEGKNNKNGKKNNRNKPININDSFLRTNYLFSKEKKRIKDRHNSLTKKQQWKNGFMCTFGSYISLRWKNVINWKRCPLLCRPNDGDVSMSIEDSGTNGSFGYRSR